ncbi:MAG: hypothetical protein JNL82_33695 [Myxococcales bacterium]|nr:hypothetical protein [Myxococcales bacterium]
MLTLIVGAAVGGAAYALAKKRQASTPVAAVTAAGAGLGGAVVTGVALSVASVLVPVALIGGVGWWLFAKKDGPKALGPGRG